ncbi:MAG TPA: hypothetical protein PLZ51_18895, partial [Aggregatilineales bacterium]|nr:hypothetical protein [Aggregatilineales bacterium]
VDDTPIPPHISHLHALYLKNKNYDSLLLSLQMSITNALKPKAKLSPFIFIGLTLIVIAIIVVGVLLINNNNNAGGIISSTETQVAQNLVETPTLTRFEQLTATAQVSASFTP